MLTEATIDCPYCGESFSTLVDYSEGQQHYIEDCQVCCRPIEVTLNVDLSGDFLGISTARDDD